MAVSVRFERVTKTFGSTRAVDDLSFDIEPGELFFLLGPSGCGKTTLLRCLAGFYSLDAGCIFIGDRDITPLAPHERDTGMVFQSYALWPHMTVRQNVSFGLEMRHIARAEAARRTDEALHMVKMEDRAEHRPNQLSGGQQQRVALARALVIHPQCLLLDEPLSNLDAKLRLEMRSEIRRICKQAGLTALYVTHDQKEALSIADRLAIINDGRIEQIGAPRSVYCRPVNSFVAGFIGETNFVPGRVARFEGESPVVETPIGPLVGTTFAQPRPVVGDRVVVSLRPEALRFSSAPPGGRNVLTGKVHHSVYLGELAQHQITLSPIDETAPPLTLKASELNPRIMARDSEQNAEVWLDPSDVIVLKE